MRALPSVFILLLTACRPPATSDAGVDAGLTMDFSTGRKILASLESRTLIMTGADIPTHPFGLDETTALNANTQCYRAITTRVMSGAFNTTVEAGLLTSLDGGARCDHTTTTATTTFASTDVLLDNVQDNGRCFDITVNYGTFSEEGRGSMAPDGTAVTLELYFGGKALFHRCEDGPVGSRSVRLAIGSAGQGRVVPLAGDSLQVYRIQ